MLKRILSLVVLVSLILFSIGCGIVGGKSHPSELVGTYYEFYGTTADYRHSLRLSSDGKAYWPMAVGNGKNGEWYVKDGKIYFEQPVYGNSVYDLSIAEQDIEYELENSFKNLSPSEKSKLKLDFKFRQDKTMWFKWK